VIAAPNFHLSFLFLVLDAKGGEKIVSHVFLESV
jgi:hypothetical protein